HVLTDRFAIGKRGVDLARAGGFDKIAWDGASNEVPSKPLVRQITHEELVDLVHYAHENGLEAYVSAGMLGERMRDAALARVAGAARAERLDGVDLLDNPTLARGRRCLALLSLARGGREERAAELGDALDRRDAVTVRELLAEGRG